MLKKILIGLLVCLAVLLGLGGYWFVGTPMYSLYLTRNAVLEKDRETFYHHFDIEQVIENALKRHAPKPPGGGPDVSVTPDNPLYRKIEPKLRDLINERLNDPKGVPVMTMSFDGVGYERERASVTLRQPSDGKTTVLVLERMKDRHWKIVEIELSQAGVEFPKVREEGLPKVIPPLPDGIQRRLPIP